MLLQINWGEALLLIFIRMDVAKMFVDDLEKKAQGLEEAFGKYVVDCDGVEGRPLRVIKCVEGPDGVEAVSELENAARDFTRAINFIESSEGLNIDTEYYRKRMEDQNITVNYHRGEHCCLFLLR